MVTRNGIIVLLGMMTVDRTPQDCKTNVRVKGPFLEREVKVVIIAFGQGHEDGSPTYVDTRQLRIPHGKGLGPLFTPACRISLRSRDKLPDMDQEKCTILKYTTVTSANKN